jgi:hypothetical protein
MSRFKQPSLNDAFYQFTGIIDALRAEKSQPRRMRTISAQPIKLGFPGYEEAGCWMDSTLTELMREYQGLRALSDELSATN